MRVYDFYLVIYQKSKGKRLYFDKSICFDLCQFVRLLMDLTNVSTSWQSLATRSLVSGLKLIPVSKTVVID